MILIKIILLTWFITHFEPIQTLLDKIYKYLPKGIQFTRSYAGCFKCVTFWITLLITFNIFYAIGLSMIAYTYDRIISSFKINI